MAVLSVSNIVTRLNHAFKDRLQNSALYQLFAELSPTPVSQTTATITVTSDYANKPIILNRAAGVTASLPRATGTGDRYTFIVGTTFTGDGSVVTTGGDLLTGTAILAADAGDTVVAFATAVDTIRLDFFDTGNVTGGLKGAHAVFTDISSGLWHVHYVSDAAGTEATPFKNA